MTATLSAPALDAQPSVEHPTARKRHRYPSVEASAVRAKVALLIEQRGWSRADIARVSGVSRGTLHNIIGGQSTITDSVAAAIGDIDPGEGDLRGLSTNDPARVGYITERLERATVRQERSRRMRALSEAPRRPVVTPESLTADLAEDFADGVPVPSGWDHDRPVLARGYRRTVVDPLTEHLPANAAALLERGEDDPETWRDVAMCAQVDPEIFFPTKGRSNGPAKAICRQCPVRQQCLDHALFNGEHHGIWGGKSTYERNRMMKRLGLRAAPEPRYFPASPRNRNPYHRPAETDVLDVGCMEDDVLDDALDVLDVAVLDDDFDTDPQHLTGETA